MLETITLAPLVSLAVAGLGIAVGLLVGHFVLPAARRGRTLQTALAALKREHEDYRRQVTTHFERTAVLVGDLTASYKAVYDHLASGARTLARPGLTGPTIEVPRLIVDDARGRTGEALPTEPLARESAAASDPGSPRGAVSPTGTVVAEPPAAAASDPGSRAAVAQPISGDPVAPDAVPSDPGRGAPTR